jgi:hypothetical protein
MFVHLSSVHRHESVFDRASHETKLGASAMTKKEKAEEKKAAVKAQSKPIDPVATEVESLLDNLEPHAADTIPPQSFTFEDRDHEELAAQSEADAELAVAMAAEDDARLLAAEREREALGLDPIEKMRRATGINIPDPNR